MNTTAGVSLKCLIAGSAPLFLSVHSAPAQMLAGDPIAKPPAPAATQPPPPSAPVLPVNPNQVFIVSGRRP